jgi:uroporphyrinogen decarboxylase
MNARERYLEVMNFNSSVRTMDWEFSYWSAAVKKWYSEGLNKRHGLTKDIALMEEGDLVVGSGMVWPLGNNPRDYDIAEQLQFDSGIEMIEFNYLFQPKFEEKIFEDAEDRVLMQDESGVKMWKKKDNSSLPHVEEGPVKTRQDWETLKEERLQPDFDSRKPANWQDAVKRYQNRDFPLSLSFHPIGFFGILRALFGTPQVYYVYYDNPGLIHHINSYLCDLWISLFSEILEKVDVDCAWFWEDMAGRQASLISHDAFKEFMSPYYKRMIGFLKSKGIRHFTVDTDGNCTGLIPLFMDCGVNGMMPFEVQANNDILELRKKYPRFVIMGGLDKRLLNYSKAEIDKELNDKLPFMLKSGGYIPAADHAILPDTNWENYKYFRERIKHYIGKGVAARN